MHTRGCATIFFTYSYFTSVSMETRREQPNDRRSLERTSTNGPLIGFTFYGMTGAAGFSLFASVEKKFIPGADYVM